MTQQHRSEPKSKNGKKVIVVGSGIAGLTAAHELIDRGFEVTVVEDGRLGGLARTQWCYGDFLASFQDGRPMAALEPIDGPAPTLRDAFGHRPSRLATEDGNLLAATIDFDRGDFALIDSAERKLERIANGIERYVRAVREEGRPHLIWHHIAVEGDAVEEEFAGAPEIPLVPPVGRYGVTEADAEDFVTRTVAGDPRARTLSRLRALVVRCWLVAQLKEGAYLDTIELRDVGLGGGVPAVFDDSNTALFARYAGGSVQFRLFDPLVPGEHGYRYFPSFYRHVFDSMRRTPLLERPPLSPRRLLEAREIGRAFDGFPFAPERRVESARTVFDNLVATRSFKIAVGDGEGLVEIPRVRSRSFRELGKLVSALFRRFHVGAEDLARFQLKIAQYLTSCPARRATYANQTWASFVGAERCSPAFQKIIERWPQALIGIRAQLADARTIGTVATQLLLDQLTTDGLRDATLNGPTSSAWLEPWADYLAQRGVSFSKGRLLELTLSEGRVAPTWRNDTPEGTPRPSVELPDYLVLAVPLREARRLVQSLWDHLSDAQRGGFPKELAQIRDFLGEPLPATDAMPVGPAGEDGSLRHYSGIQFYLSYDLGPADGHVYLADSDWRLSAISQTQFWQRRFLNTAEAESIPGAEFVSILSVDIGDWYAPSRRGALRAVDCRRAELAAEVWQQIVEGISTKKWSPPEPLAYHIDDDMIFGADGKPAENRAPYLVNVAGGWERRPGPDDLQDGYPVVYDSLVVAGTFMKTHTRLATMESANESARHAVNGLLLHHRAATAAKTSLPCQVWNPESHELDDLDFLKEVDAELMNKGLPHLLEILDVERLIDGGIDVLSSDVILLGVLDRAAAPAAAGLPMHLLRRALESLFG